MRGTKFGGIGLVAKNPSIDPKAEPDSTAADMAAADGDDAALRDPAWSREIRDYYNAVANEPIPQEFLDLLARIAPDIAE